MKIRWIVIALFLIVVGLVAVTHAQRNRRERQLAALTQPFVGVTTDGTPVPGLFRIKATGVSTEPVRQAAQRFLDGLNQQQRQATQFPVDSSEWRDWNNVHRAPREGVSFGQMNALQRESAVALFEASLSAKGLQKTRNVMRLNEHLAELLGKHDEYGEELYFVTVMGQPSRVNPWGWQLDGHHLVINYLVLGDQVVLSPSFMGSEPVVGSGKFSGVEVLQDEQDKGLALMEALNSGQQAMARLDQEKTGADALAQAFNDNLVLDFAGIPATQLNARQKELLRAVIREYVFNLSEGHARLRMTEIEAHLDGTYFAWIGTTGPESVFYYRIHSPVILIEFDHQGPIALGGPRVPSRRHVHSVVRTPNGNDYGKDLLRQHYRAHREDASHGHRR